MGSSGSTTGAQHETVHCERHGDRRKAYVCDHLLHEDHQGFFIDCDEAPTNPHPDAWCTTCERIRLAHGGWNETSESLIEVRLVCGDCYEEIKEINMLGTEGTKTVQ
jgi:hypothetical protein